MKSVPDANSAAYSVLMQWDTADLWKRNPHLAPWFQIATYVYLGREKEIPDVIAEYLKIRGWEKLPPNFIKTIMQWYQFKDQTQRERLVEGLRKAGLT